MGRYGKHSDPKGGKMGNLKHYELSYWTDTIINGEKTENKEFVFGAEGMLT
jgi:hypothetical protein